MKFEIELIEGGRCIIPMEGNTGLIVVDDDLGAALRGIKGNAKPEKRKYPKGTRKRRKAETPAGEATA